MTAIGDLQLKRLGCSTKGNHVQQLFAAQNQFWWGALAHIDRRLAEVQTDSGSFDWRSEGAAIASDDLSRGSTGLTW